MQAFGDHVIAFRIVWRVGDVGLPKAWDAVVSQRHLCDETVAQTSSLQMFVSCISGVFNTATTWRDQLNPVYPAVSYWAVCDDAMAERDVVLRLMAVCPNAQVKKIQTFRMRQVDESSVANSGTLFIALKDHNSDYVHKKISRCLLASDGVERYRPPNAKLCVLHQSKYLEKLPSSVEALKSAGLRIDMEMVVGT